MLTFDPVFAYFGPETVLPVTSVIATVAGVAMMFGRSSTRFLVRCCRLLFLRSGRIITISRPHFRSRVRKPSRVQVSGRRSAKHQAGRIDT